MDRFPVGLNHRPQQDDHQVLSADDEDDAMFKLTINQRLGIPEAAPTASGLRQLSEQAVKVEEQAKESTSRASPSQRAQVTTSHANSAASPGNNS